MKGGGFNRVFGLKFRAERISECVLRIPRFAMDDDQAVEISDQVSILSHISRYHFLHVPTNFAFDTTKDNAIGFQYVLQQRLRGKSIPNVFYDLPMSEKLQITKLVAELLIKMESIKLDKPGRLIGDRSLPRASNKPPFSANVDIIGYRYNPVTDMPAIEKQSLVSFLSSLFEMQKQNDHNFPPLVDMCSRLQRIGREMERAGFMRNSDDECVLWHWDLSASNIMIDRTSPPAASNEGSVDVTKDADEGLGKQISQIVDPEEKHSGKGCQHSVQITIEDASSNGMKHTVNVNVEGDLGKGCNHNVQVEVENASGKKYRHSLQISNANTSRSALGNPTNALNDIEHCNKSSPDALQGDWVITGVLDWDDVLSVPLVLARKPPSCLWFNEDTRTPRWSGDRDTEPERDLTRDELLIKAHFDQTMQRASSTYIEDTYRRGPWLRALARFALYGFGDNEDFKRYDRFVGQWNEYYSTISGRDEDVQGDSSEDDGEASDEGSESSSDAEEDEEMGSDIEVGDADQAREN